MPESWVKVESVYEATVESSDNPVEVSKMLFEQARKEVVENINEITTKMKEANAALSRTAATGSTGGSAPAASIDNGPKPL